MEAILKRIRMMGRMYVLIFFIFISFGLMTVLSYLFMSNIVESHLNSEANETLSHIELQITADFKELETMLYLISDTIHDMIKQEASTEEVTNYILTITHQIRAQNHVPSFVAVTGLLNINGRTHINGLNLPEPADVIYEERPWFKAAVAAGGDVGVTDPYSNLIFGDMWITFSRCLYDEDNNILAVVCIDVSLDRIKKFTENINFEGTGSFNVITDPLHTFISHPQAELIGSSIADIGLEEIKEDYNLSGRRLEVDGERFVVNSKKIDNGWHIAVVSAIDEYYSDLYAIRIYLFILSFGFAIILSIIIYFIDEARKKAEAEKNKAIEHSNALNHLETILNGLDAMVYVSDPETSELLFINNSMRKHYGVGDDYVGQYCYKLLQEGKDEPCGFCPCKRLKKNPGQVIIWEEHIKSKDHIYRNIDRFIDWPGGKKVHLQYSVEITDLKEATKALDKQLRQQALMTSISQNFLFSDEVDTMMGTALSMVGESMGISQILLYVIEQNDARFVCVNEWVNSDYHLSSRIGESLLLSKAMLGLLDNRNDSNVICLTSDDRRVREIMAPYRKNFQGFMTTSIFVDDHLYAVLDFSRDDGERWSHSEKDIAILFTNILTGAFQRRAVSDQLITAKEQAEESNRSKSIFLANMSHEIRTPMNSILGMTEIQLQEESLPPDIEDAFNIIYDSGNLLINIINDILDFSKIEAGKLELNPVNYDIPSLLNDTVQLIRLRYESKPLDFKLEIAENTPLKWFGDELRIKQILNNLLSNAFKYTDKGSVSLNIMTERDIDENCILIFKVSDTGQGMSEEQLRNLFDEYTRFSKSRYTVGTGLGMSITKRLLNLMNGQIFVESELNVGSVFTVRIPQINIGSSVCDVEIVNSLQKSRFSTSKSRKIQFKREYMPYGNVLVVDDVETNLYVAKGLLLSYGLKIQTALSGFEAIELIKAGNVYDIIFMDHMMPQMDGVEAHRIIRELGYNNPIVALTANVIAGQADLFMANGFNGFISKPIDIRELNVILNQLIRDKQPPEVIEAARRKVSKKSPLHDNFIKTEAIKEAFVRDAEGAYKVLNDIYPRLDKNDKDDLSLYITSVHGLKSVLKIINENALSTFALKLEKAGRVNNISLLLKETPIFLEKLGSLISEIKSEVNNTNEAASLDDIELLREKLAVIKKACSTYDKKTARAVLNEIKSKKWPDEVESKLDLIAKELLHSGFKSVVEIVEQMEDI